MKYSFLMALACLLAQEAFANNCQGALLSNETYLIQMASIKADTNYYYGQTVYVNASELNLRGGPSIDYDRVKLLPRGTALTFLEDHGEFVKVKTKDGYMGYVAKIYISDIKKAASNTNTTATTTKTNTKNADPYPYNHKVYDYNEVAYIIANEVNLREGPSTNNNKIMLLKKGDALRVLGHEEQQPNGELFIQVKEVRSGKIGYLVKRFIK